ncbi:MAG: hypothetical protein IH959_01475 [Chloroflexi bacterium]|nr:hypothetical protein [Chloroflexota bacterium]
MQYVPYGPELAGVPHVIVDGQGNDATVLALSHWPGNQTPPELKADSSTEIVLNYLRSSRRDEYRRDAEAVSNNHYDIDGLMSVWAMLSPEAALERADLLVAIGECGDFDRWSGAQATKVTCALHGLEMLPSSPMHQRLAAVQDDLERTALQYREMLPLVPQLLDDIDHFEEYWRDEYRQVEVDREFLVNGEATVQESAELDVAVFQLARPVHDMALYEQTQCSRVVLVIDEHRYDARYRYESWVELQSRRPPPRIDLRPFADLLQTFEGNPGDWEADEVQAIVPRLRLVGPEGDPSPSSITPGLFVRLLAQYLRENESNQELLWSPQTADAEYVSE